MKKRIQQLLPYLALLALTALVMNMYFRTMLGAPNRYVMGLYGDTGKSYFTADYFARHDKGDIFTGMNYPNGIHAVFAENPAFLLITRWFSQHVFSLEGKMDAVLNLTILSTLVVCALFVYAVLRKNNLSRWAAVPFAVLITFLSPQVDRISYHLALGWVFFFPMTWYLLILIFERQPRWHWLWIGLISLSTGFFAMVHLYYFLIIFIFSSVFIATDFLQNIKKWKNNILYVYLPTFFAIVLPVVLIRLWIKASADPTDEVVRIPYGFFDYHASLRSVFLPPPGSPVLAVIKSARNVEDYFTVEANGYVGLVTASITGLLLLRMGMQLVRGRFRQVLRPVLPQPLRAALVAALAMLFMSTIILFKWYEPASFWVSEIRQFRSMGRVAWGFYFVFSVLAAHTLYRLYRAIALYSRGKLRYVGAGILALAWIVWGIEANVLMKVKKEHSEATALETYNRFWRVDIRPMLEQAGKPANQFQAILALPYYNLGSEKFLIDGSSGAVPYSMAASIYTGLPLIDNASARTPLAQTCRSVQLFSNTLIHKEFIDRLTDKRPLLLVYDTMATIPPAQQRLIDKSVFLFRDVQIVYASLDLSAFADTRDSTRAAFAQLKPSLTPGAGFLAQGDPGGVVWDGYGDALWETTGDSPNAAHLLNNLKTTNRKLIFDKEVRTSGQNVLMEFSCWIKIDGNDHYLPTFAIREIDKSTGQIIANGEFRPEGCVDVYGTWARVSTLLAIANPGNRVQLLVDDRHFTLDHFLLRPKATDVWVQHPDGRLVLNNYPLF